MDNQNHVGGSDTVTYFDPDEFQSAVRGGDAMYNVLSRGRYRAELTTIKVGQLMVQRGKEALPRISSTSLPPSMIALCGWFGDGQPPVVRGAQMQRGEFICLGPRMQSHHRTFGNNDFAALTVDVTDLTNAAMDLTGRELAVPAGKVIQPPPHLGVWLLSVIDAATRASMATPDIFQSPPAARALEQALLRPMIGCLMDGCARSEGVPRGHRATVAKRFEAAVEANLEHPLLISDLCRMVAITARSLNSLCQEQLGMSAQRFLALRRLHMARRALTRSDSSSATVTEIAMSYGIWELGRFAVAYKALFGESPSTTLRRPPASCQPEVYFPRTAPVEAA